MATTIHPTHLEVILQAICVYSSSSDAVPQHYFDAAEQLGGCIGQAGYNMVYGGGCIGLMGASARAVQRSGGKVVGVIPHFLNIPGVVYEQADELILTHDMRERKSVMAERSDAFIALPGGFGTLEEMLEMITLKQLGQHTKPIVFINTEGFYDPLINTFELMFTQQFAKPEYRELYHLAPDATDALAYIQSYQPSERLVKWF